MLKPDQRVGILTANSDSLGERHFNAVGWSAKDVPIAVQGLQRWDEFREVFQDRKEVLDVDLVAQNMAEAAQKAGAGASGCGRHCPGVHQYAPYAHVVQAAVDLPVFDIQTLVNLMYEGTHRRPYCGDV